MLPPVAVLIFHTMQVSIFCKDTFVQQSFYITHDIYIARTRAWIILAGIIKLSTVTRRDQYCVKMVKATFTMRKSLSGSCTCHLSCYYIIIHGESVALIMYFSTTSQRGSPDLSTITIWL